MMKPGAIMLMGLPGAGKGTQAFRLAKRLPRFLHFDTGGEIYRRITDPAFENDPIVQEQKEIYFAGKLTNPEWVASLVVERIRFHSGKGLGVIFSASPRTLYEAQAILPLSIECYGKERILVVEIVVSAETARARSLTRITCANKICRFPTTQPQGGTPCPNCGQTLPAGMQADEQWKVGRFDTRLKEFEERTRLAIKFLREQVAYVHIDGEKKVEDVFRQVLAAVREKL